MIIFPPSNNAVIGTAAIRTHCLSWYLSSRNFDREALRPVASIFAGRDARVHFLFHPTDRGVIRIGWTNKQDFCVVLFTCPIREKTKENEIMCAFVNLYRLTAREKI